MREPLVLLPGLLCDRAVWEEQIAALSDVAECTCADYGLLDSLVAMAQLVLREAPEKFALAGHSMGGRVALEVYRLAPQRVLRLALFDTGCGPQIVDEAPGRYALLQVARTEGMRAMALRWLPPMLQAGRMKDADLVERILRMFGRKTPEIHEAQIRALLSRPDATGVPGQVRCPALLLTGEQDALSPPAGHAWMAAAIPGSSLVAIPDCGHMAPMERPEQVTRAMREWLGETWPHSQV